MELERWIIWNPKTCCPPWGGGKKTCSTTSNMGISEMVRKEGERFCMHINIDIGYKILWFGVHKVVPILHSLASFHKGIYAVVYEIKHHL
jgi:hypothetical protein